MTLVWQKATNISLSIQKPLGDAVTWDGVDYEIHWGRWGDPDENTDPSVVPAPGWLAAQWLTQSAMKRGEHLLQVDVLTRIGAPGTGDQYGVLCSQIADVVEEVYSKPNGHCIPVYDYSNVATPFATGKKVLCRLSGGQNGVPVERTVIPWENGLNRITLLFRFVGLLDLMGPMDYQIV